MQLLLYGTQKLTSFRTPRLAGAQDELSEDALALRALAEAIEGAVRGNGTQELGLDWD